MTAIFAFARIVGLDVCCHQVDRIDRDKLQTLDLVEIGNVITQVHNAARGYPRAVNNLAVHALTAAFAAKSAIVDEKSARIAVTESGHD